MIRKKLVKWLKEKKLTEQDELYFELFLSRIENNENFSLSRFGDGEWNAVLNVIGENCDGHQYFQDMRIALKQVFEKKNNYYIGIQPLAIRQMLPQMLPLIYKHQQHYFNADIFHKASEYGFISLLFNVLNKRQLILVGPPYLANLEILSIKHHITISRKNCWLNKDETLAKVRKHLTGERNVIVLFVASMASNIMIDNLFEEYQHQHSFIDIGSLLDPYVGIQTRSYHKKLSIANN